MYEPAEPDFAAGLVPVLVLAEHRDDEVSAGSGSVTWVSNTGQSFIDHADFRIASTAGLYRVSSAFDIFPKLGEGAGRFFTDI